MDVTDTDGLKVERMQNRNVEDIPQKEVRRAVMHLKMGEGGNVNGMGHELLKSGDDDDVERI